MLQKSGLQKTLVFCTRFTELSALNTNKKWKTSDFYGSSSMMPHCQKSTKFKYTIMQKFCGESWDFCNSDLPCCSLCVNVPLYSHPDWKVDGLIHVTPHTKIGTPDTHFQMLFTCNASVLLAVSLFPPPPPSHMWLQVWVHMLCVCVCVWACVYFW